MPDITIAVQLPEGDVVYAYGTSALREVFADEGWYAIERAAFFQVLPHARRQLVLADVTTDRDDQFRYYRGTLRDVETGAAVGEPIEWDVRWLL